MATGSILLPLDAVVLPSGAVDPAGIFGGPNRLKLLFDDTTPEECSWQFRMPENYSSAPTLKLFYAMAAGTSGTVEFEASLMAVSDGDTQDFDTDSFDALNTGTGAVAATAGLVDEISISLSNNDSLAAGDLIVLKLSRDADDATNDTATSDCEVLACTLEYTTS